MDAIPTDGCLVDQTFNQALSVVVKKAKELFALRSDLGVTAI